MATAPNDLLIKYWTYSQGTGKLYDPQGKHVHTGYSGYGQGRNSCEWQGAVAKGPIPQGWWDIGKPYNSKNVGPFSMRLTAREGTQTFGRSAFVLHGDNGDKHLDESKGCIIMPRRIRERVWNSGVHLLRVVP